MTLQDLRLRYPTAATFTFGDNRELGNTLLALVRSGAKTATCGPLRDFAPGKEAMPVAGRMDIALEWDGTPACVIETTDVVQCRFDEVDAAFALAEGENDSLAGWQSDHRAYFARNGGFSPQMIVVCERFRLVEDLAPE